MGEDTYRHRYFGNVSFIVGNFISAKYWYKSNESKAKLRNVRERETIDLSKKRLHYIASVSPEKTRGSPCDWLKAADDNNKNLVEKIFILEKLKIHLSGNCAVPSSSIFPSSDEGSFYVSSIIALNRLETLFMQTFAFFIAMPLFTFTKNTHQYIFAKNTHQYVFAKNINQYIFAKIHKQILFPRWLTLLHVEYWTRTPPARHLVVLLLLKNCLQGKPL